MMTSPRRVGCFVTTTLARRNGSSWTLTTTCWGRVHWSGLSRRTRRHGVVMTVARSILNHISKSLTCTYSYPFALIQTCVNWIARLGLMKMTVLDCHLRWSSRILNQLKRLFLSTVRLNCWSPDPLSSTNLLHSSLTLKYPRFHPKVREIYQNWFSPRVHQLWPHNWSVDLKLERHWETRKLSRKYPETCGRRPAGKWAWQPS